MAPRPALRPPDDTPPPMFGGFSEKTIKFLRGLKKNNNKAWFEAHRAEYDEYLREPSKALIEVMDALFRDQKMPFVANAKRSLFRINRDIRFSSDKSPYKSHIGFSFPVDGMSKENWCGCYLGFEPKGAGDVSVFLGGGIYQPMPDQLKQLRRKIADDHKELKALLNDKAFKKEFPEGLKGESLKRMPIGYAEDHPAAEMLKMKQFLFSSSLTKDQLLDDDLPKILLKKFKAAEKVALWLAR
jgi:uncharacterized protein (TIGR02453 family)